MLIRVQLPDDPAAWAVLADAVGQPGLVDSVERTAEGAELSIDLPGPSAWLTWLNGLAVVNATLIERGEAPALYGSGVRYEREPVEVWATPERALRTGTADCEDLAAWQAGALMALGWRAMVPSMEGYATAVRRKLDSIPAEVELLREDDGLYHAVVRYRVGAWTAEDDPSARLGMDFVIDPAVKAAEASARVAVEGRMLVPLRTSISGGAWGAPVEVDKLVKIAPAQGYRAAVQPLEPGLWLVAAVPESQISGTQIGAAGLATALTAAGLKALLAKAGAGAAKGAGRAIVDRVRERRASGDGLEISELLDRVRDRERRPVAELVERLRERRASGEGLQVSELLDRLRDRGGFNLRREAPLRLPGPVEIGGRSCAGPCGCGR